MDAMFKLVASVPSLVLQTFDLMIFQWMSFPGTRWYVVSVPEPEVLRDQKKVGNFWRKRKNKTGFGANDAFLDWMDVRIECWEADERQGMTRRPRTSQNAPRPNQT